MRKTELPALTGIRFYAALSVFFSHISVIPGVETVTGDTLPFNLGVVGVSFFFALSGFILTYNYAEKFQESVSLAGFTKFTWDRATKIFPVHWAMLGVMIPVQLYSPHLPLDWRAVPVHLFLLQCFWPFPTPAFNSYLNVPSWSISCEWFFYLVAPLSIHFVLSRSRWWIPLAIVLLYTVSMDYFLSAHVSDAQRFYYIYSFAPSRVFEFLAGIFLARLYLSLEAQPSVLFSGLLQVAGVILLGAGAFYRASAPWPFHGGLLYLPGSLLLIFGLALGRGVFAAHLAGARLTRLGMASFSFYLIHVPILRIAKGVCLRFGWEVRSWSMFVLLAVAMYAVIQVIAILVFRWFELPVQRELRRQYSKSAALVPSCSTS